MQLTVVDGAMRAGLGTSSGAVPRATLLELFTSEGCSSCLPAEVVANELSQRTDVLPLFIHVDYWEGLGWRDVYSRASATERQRRYARSLRKSCVYTPQAVVDGSRDVVGSERSAMTRAVAGAREGVATALSVDNVEIQILLEPGQRGVLPTWCC